MAPTDVANRRPGIGSVGIVLLALALFPVSVSATLYGVAYDRILDHESLVRVSTVNAAISDNAQVALPGCCRASGSLVAADDVAQTVYFVTPDPNPLLAWRLHRISLVTGASVTATLPADERVVAILRRSATATLYALSDLGNTGLRLVTISDAGAVSNAGAPILADCCGVRVGVAALSADASRIAFVARLKTASDPASRLIVISTATGALISNVVPAHVPDVLFSISGSGFSAIYHDAGTEYVGAIAADGSITPAGAGIAGCCELAAGVGARNGALMRIVARAPGAADFSLYEVNTGTGAFTPIGVIAPRHVVNGLVESSVVLASDLIFRDGFDPASTIALTDPVNADPGRSPAAAQAFADVDQDPAADLHGVPPSTLDSRSAEIARGALPAVVAALPLGGKLASGFLVVLLVLFATRFRRRAQAATT